MILIFGGDLFAQKGERIQTVVIDAGHGGKDPGALGKHVREKDIALSVALKTGHYIKENFPDVRVIYTRNSDKFIPLYERGEIANRNNADLFISIHCNANNNTSVYGAETYVLGIEEKRTKLNMDVAMLENAAILLEDASSDQYGDFDPRSQEAIIGLTLFQSEYLDQSLNYAAKVQQQFTERVGRKDRSVHQAGFLVLWKTAMPSVLIELGYLSNPKEEEFLASEKGQVYLASAIYRAFKAYKSEFEAENHQDSHEQSVNVRKNTTNVVDESATTGLQDGIEFRVQFYASPKEIPLNDKRFQGLSTLNVYEHAGMFKYTTGSFNGLKAAQQYQKTIREKGFSDAFVVAFDHGRRIEMEEAKRKANP